MQRVGDGKKSRKESGFNFSTPFFTKAYKGYKEKKYGVVIEWLEGLENTFLTSYQKRLRYYLLAVCFYEQGFFLKALEELKSLNTLGEENPFTFVFMGLSYEKVWQDTEAIFYYKKAIEVFPGYRPAYERLGDLYLRKGYYLEALESYEVILENGLGKAPSIVFKLGLVHYLLGSYGAVEVLLRGLPSLERNRFLPQFFFLQGLSYRKQGEREAAASFFKKAAGSATREDVSYYLYMQAVYALETKSISDASELLEKGFYRLYIQDEYFFTIARLLGKLHLEQKNYTKSYFYYRKLLDKKKAGALGAGTLYLIAFNAFKLGKDRAALELLEKVANLKRREQREGGEEKKAVYFFGDLLRLRIERKLDSTKNVYRAKGDLEKLWLGAGGQELSTVLLKEKLLLEFDFSPNSFLMRYKESINAVSSVALRNFRPLLIDYFESIKDYYSAILVLKEQYEEDSRFSTQLLRRLGNNYLRLEKLELSEKYLTLALEKSVGVVERGKVLSSLAYVAYRKGEVEKAEELLIETSKIASLKVGAWYNLVVIGKYKEDNVLMEKGIAKINLLLEGRGKEKELTSTALKIKFYLFASKFYLKKKRLKKARHAILRAKALAPRDETVVYFMKKYITF